MKRSITRWITTLSTAAALAVPAMTLAQTPEQQPPPQQTPPQQTTPQQTPPQQTPPQQTPPQQTTPQQTPPQQIPPQQAQPAEQPSASLPAADQAVAPQEHLKQAKAALDRIQTTSLTSRGRTQLAELKRHLTALERGSADVSPRSTRKTTAHSTPTWGAEVAATDKILTDLLGTSSTTGTSGTTGTTGVAGSAGTARSTAATTVPLDEATRAALMEVRSHLVAYATGMSGAAPPKGDAAMPSAATPSAAIPSKDEPSYTRSPASAQSTSSRQSSPAIVGATADARQQVDQEAARRHLRAARDTLNQLTQLPASAQLTGEARTQVTQLIANFNELMTTQTQWHASYGKTAANLNALLGPDNTDAAPTAAVAPTPTETPAAPAAVGTSGVGTVDVDPAIRAKLVELRRNLTEFEKAMGGPGQE
jgi:hypothetical protein